MTTAGQKWKHVAFGHPDARDALTLGMHSHVKWDANDLFSLGS